MRRPASSAPFLAIAVLVSGLLAACGDDRARETMPDARVDPCLLCAAGQICVAKYDGVCTPQVACVAKTVDCPLNACSTACESAYCAPSPYQCKTRSPCGGESPNAFTCYGP